MNIQRRRIIDEYSLGNIAKTLQDPINACESTAFRVFSFYLPLQDPENMPEQGKYGGDSFLVDELNDGRLFVIFRNGVGHGMLGRNAIKRSNSVLDDLLLGTVAEDDISEKIKKIDLFSDLGTLAYCWNELALRRHGGRSPKQSALSTLIAGTHHAAQFKYVNFGDSYILICGKDIKNINELKSGKYGIGSPIMTLMLKKRVDYLNSLTADIESGNKLILISDGITESRDKNDEKNLFGIDRVTAIINTNITSSSNQIIRALNDAVADFTQNKLADDYTILLLEKK